ncbi:protein of unknown function [Candidatus Methylopumilus turicensis]|uniref:Uncharacterized protein n=1 Tax=Candidatus Methylopumilus turicensis TaxID=1581680 RepID=A0A0B7J0F6_9PROT|nr:protein of unknown function [Candidatus Methylopumilus turicensis]
MVSCIWYLVARYLSSIFSSVVLILVLSALIERFYALYCHDKGLPLIALKSLPRREMALPEAPSLGYNCCNFLRLKNFNDCIKQSSIAVKPEF